VANITKISYQYFFQFLRYLAEHTWHAENQTRVNNFMIMRYCTSK